MRDELTPAELEEIALGKKAVAQAEFFTEDVLDVDASREANVRTFKKMDYIRLWNKRENTANIRPATKADQRLFPEAWKAYQEKLNDEQSLDTCQTIPEGYLYVAR